MKLNTLIIDNFLDNPDEVRNLVIKNQVPFNIEGAYPGKRTPPVENPVYKNMIIEKLHEVLPFKIKMKDFSFSFQLSLSSDTVATLHVDPTQWAAVLYLTPNAPIDSGTLLFKEDVELKKKLREDDVDGEVRAHVTSTLGNVYNRLVLLRGPRICNPGLRKRGGSYLSVRCSSKKIPYVGIFRSEIFGEKVSL